MGLQLQAKKVKTVWVSSPAHLSLSCRVETWSSKKKLYWLETCIELEKSLDLSWVKALLFELSLFHSRVETLNVIVNERPKCTYHIGKVQCEELKLLNLSLKINQVLHLDLNLKV